MPAGRVVRALALVAVRQQQRHRGALAPLRLAGGDELVDDRLGAVGEVAELGLPQTSASGCLHRVAVLEAHRRVLAEQRVVDEEPAAVVVLQRVQRQVVLAGLGVDDGRVPLDERAAAGVLPGQPHGHALAEQRAEREDLAEAPVDVAVDGHRGPPVEQLLDPLVRGEARRAALTWASPIAGPGRPGRPRCPPVGSGSGAREPVGRDGGRRGVAGRLEDLLQLRAGSRAATPRPPRRVMSPRPISSSV